MPQFIPKSPFEFILDQSCEEAAEIIQSAAKAKRFGLHHPYPRTGITNIAHLQNEIYDFVACVKQLNAELEALGEQPLRLFDAEAVQNKLDKMRKYSQMSIELGLLSEPLAECKLNILSGLG